jgi:predicted RNase H-like nuclease
LIEVYPHPAIVQLLRLKKRLPYKVARSGRYWRSETPRPGIAVRIDRLLAAFNALRIALDQHIDRIELPVLAPVRLSRLKPLEDALDALVCCWVGIEFLEGRTEAYGDSTAAIWVPRAAG